MNHPRTQILSLYKQLLRCAAKFPSKNRDGIFRDIRLGMCLYVAFASAAADSRRYGPRRIPSQSHAYGSLFNR